MGNGLKRVLSISARLKSVAQSAVTNASDKLPLALVTAFARHKQINGESCVYKFILFFQFKVISLLNWYVF